MNAKEVSYVGEVWKDIKDYEDEYEVSNLGRVRNKKTKKILKSFLNRGYLRVNLSKNGKEKKYSVHRLVYETFIGEIPEGYEINHKDENPQNNNLSNLNLLIHKANLNWGTRNERIAKSLTNHPKRSKSVIQKTLQGEIIKVWASAREVQRELGYNHSHISHCCRGGYYWKGKWVNYTQAYNYLWEYEKATA